MIWALLLAATALGSETPHTLQTERGTPFTIGKGHYAFGLFSPVTIGLSEKTDLTTTGWESLVAPQVDLKHQLVDSDGLGVAVVGGLGVPTLGLKLLQGTVLSSDVNQDVGFAAVFKAGIIGGYRMDSLTVSLGVDGRAGVHGSGWGLESPGWFFLDPMLAPLTEGPVVRPRLVVDWFPIEDRFGLTLDSWIQIGGTGPDWDNRLFAQLALSRKIALGAGVIVGFERFERGRDAQIVPVFDIRFRHTGVKSMAGDDS